VADPDFQRVWDYIQLTNKVEEPISNNDLPDGSASDAVKI